MTDPVRGRLTRFEVRTNVPYGTFKGADFIRLDGLVHGELTTAESVPGLAQAAKNLRGPLNYTAPFVLIVPRSARGANRTLLIDVPNRGRPIAHHLYNSPREHFLPVGSFEPGNGFLQEHGFGVAMLQWELGHGITLPVFTDASGTMRHVEAAGIAAIRDFAHFLRTAEVDTLGTPNPVFGQFDLTLAVGYSQTSRVLKTMLVEGCDLVDGRRVFDAIHLHAGAAGLAPIFATGSGPASGTSLTPNFADPRVRGVAEEPLTYAGIVSRASTNAAAHAAARATKHAAALPKLLVTNVGTDYFSLRASLARTGAQGTADAPIPPNVRIYDVAGASHSRAAESTCQLPPAQLDYFPVLRATLLNLEAWVRNATEPPSSRLMPLEPLPAHESVLPAPAHLPDAIVQTPRRDADGNAVGGVRLPDMEAPLGTHGGQNRPLTESPCNLIAAFSAFARTAAERVAGDTRPALAERYAGHEAYVGRVRGAARQLVDDRFLSQADALEIERAARTVAPW